MTEAATESRSIVVERTLAHPPEKVWRALTEPSLIARWLMQNDFVPEVGRRFNFRATPIPNAWNGVTDCEVLEVVPFRRLVYSWCASGEEAEGGLKTTVTWTLTPAAGGTHVRMEQAGFRPQDEMGRQAMSGGWPGMVERLGEVAGDL
jgi:uncharacterized protein YndB with AHSA1/START domain